MRRWLAALFGGLALAWLAGCSSDEPRVVKVGGTVTRHGKPVANATVHFAPLKGRPSWGVSDENGRYALHYDKTREGAVTGTHRVYVEFKANSPKEELQRQRGELQFPPEHQAILDRYGKLDATPLRVEVGTDDDQEIPIKLD
jgi:hypothetical protein